jgi:hypothetical protein
MDRMIKNYNPDEITLEFLQSDEWDIISLNKKIDPLIADWYTTVENTLNHLSFNFQYNSQLTNYPIDNAYTDGSPSKFKLSEADPSLIFSYTLTWPIQRYDPLPPLWAANLELYPEIKKYTLENGNVSNVNYKEWEYLDLYMFGVFKDVVSEWGMRYWKNPRISKHEPGLILPIHNDHSLARIHIPMTTGNAKFYWGENGTENIPSMLETFILLILIFYILQQILILPHEQIL